MTGNQRVITTACNVYNLRWGNCYKEILQELWQKPNDKHSGFDNFTKVR